jgi:3'-5' exoribonuclease
MKDFYIRDAAQQENKVISTSFLVTSKQLKPKKTGEPYLDLMLADSTGQIPAKMWDNVPAASEMFDVNDVIRVKGVFNKYNHRWQFTARSLEGKLRDDQIEFGDYLPRTAKDIDELWKSLGDSVASITQPHLRALLQAFMADPQIAHAYRNAPAAKTLHHAFIGGLLEHVVSLFRSCELLVQNYPHINRDLLLTGAFLHDIGKIHELAYARSFSYTTEGQLLGHMIIELDMLREKVKLVSGFPEKLKLLIEHLIISHHGQYEFGSPKLPMFPEALMLHYLDDLDSKVEAMRAQMERDAEMESPWTTYNPSLARPLLNTQKYLADIEKEEKSAAAAAAANGSE